MNPLNYSLGFFMLWAADSQPLFCLLLAALGSHNVKERQGTNYNSTSQA